MQQIINAIIRNKNFILFIGLLCFSFFFLSNRSLYHQSKFDQFWTSNIGKIYNVSFKINEYFNLKKINNELLKENEKLKQVYLNRFDNNLNFQKKITFKVYHGKVIKNSIKSSRNYLIINKGKKDSIQTEMGVISSSGIVGVINSISENYSSAISILNKDLQINAKFKKNNAFGSLNWNGVNTNKIQLNDIPVINEVSIGDSIVTGGMSTYFPEGIMIGRVSDYNIIYGTGYYKINVELISRVGNLINVYVLKNKYQKEINSLE